MSAQLNPAEIAFSPTPEKPKSFKYSYPPFPSVPEGVTIVPFKDFKEHGIPVFEGDDDVEKDGLGIPTIQLRVKHDTDYSKTNPNRKRKTGRELRGAFRKEWWEDWEEGEDLRNHGPYDVNVAAVDRFHQAASDFQKYRKFPPISTNVQALWDQFRIFAGLLGTTPVWQKASEKPADDAGAEVSDDEFDDDEDSGSKSVNQGGPGERRHPARLRPRAPYDLYGKAPVIVEDNDDIRKLLDGARAEKEDKVVEFLNNPARSIQIFLSSYMNRQGFVYADRNLVSTPHLLRFFVNYLLRNQVLPDKTTERSLKSALQIIDAAAKELPLTAELAKKLPDDFSMACQSCWDPRGDNSLDAWDAADTAADESGADDKINPDAAFESTLKDENVEVIKHEDVLGADATSDADTATGGDGVYDPSSFTPADSWEHANGSPPEAEWAPPPARVSALPPRPDCPPTHAHARHRRVVRPAYQERHPALSTGAAEDRAPDAEAVERDLEARMARVVMAPWVGWDGPEVPPRILRGSLGALTTSAAEAAVSSANATASPPPAAPAPPPALGPGGLKPHDMLADDITLLLEPAVAQTLSLNMGLGGTWVQLARLVDVAAPAPAAAEGDGTEKANMKPQKKKALTKAQKERRGLRYWYLDDHMMVLPSYWLV
ncbi:hypothetical protein MVEN_01176000 [Mycena venus]|uniref:Uncharacterized protein n=1 Tax=Mycena venus TaxID=2733690 RepID=A0A8H6Y584_9AGAR|nr:hypothetical protein MVEN_01176000 [Mycena venus]